MKYIKGFSDFLLEAKNISNRDVWQMVDKITKYDIKKPAFLKAVKTIDDKFTSEPSEEENDKLLYGEDSTLYFTHDGDLIGAFDNEDKLGQIWYNEELFKNLGLKV